MQLLKKAAFGGAGLCAFTLAAMASGTPATDQPVAKAVPLKSHAGKVKKPKKVTKLMIEELKEGTGAEAKSGNTVTVNYRGTLENGTLFDESYGRGPFTFHLGAGEVIKGWDQGVAGMKEGGKRKLTIPPELGYGARGAGGVIPPNATLIFEVELVKVDK